MRATWSGRTRTNFIILLGPIVVRNGHSNSNIPLDAGFPRITIMPILWYKLRNSSNFCRLPHGETPDRVARGMRYHPGDFQAPAGVPYLLFREGFDLHKPLKRLEDHRTSGLAGASQALASERIKPAKYFQREQINRSRHTHHTPAHILTCRIRSSRSASSASDVPKWQTLGDVDSSTDQMKASHVFSDCRTVLTSLMGRFLSPDAQYSPRNVRYGVTL